MAKTVVDGFVGFGSTAIQTVVLYLVQYPSDFELHVKFKKHFAGARPGRTYVYVCGGGVNSVAVFSQWKNAPSKGRFYLEQIKKPFDYTARY